MENIFKKYRGKHFQPKEGHDMKGHEAFRTPNRLDSPTHTKILLPHNYQNAKHKKKGVLRAAKEKKVI